MMSLEGLNKTAKPSVSVTEREFIKQATIERLNIRTSVWDDYSEVSFCGFARSLRANVWVML
jgi:hypothetical protein